MKKIVLISVAFLSILLLGCSISIGNKEYYCDSGDTLKGSTCITKNTTPAQIEYYCTLSGYYPVGNRCVKDYGSFKSYLDAQKRYYCSSGYLKGTNCIIETTYNAYER